MTQIAIFASGNGSNAENIITHFRKTNTACVSLILTNNPKAYVLKRSKKHGIKSVVFSKEDLYQTDSIQEILIKQQIDFIVLAGFLWLVPSCLIRDYSNRIINIHPALLPKFGGKGMYGMKVHQAVINTKEKTTGITIHYVNENYDEGSVIFQAHCIIEPQDTPETIAQKVHELEYRYYPEIIEKCISK